MFATIFLNYKYKNETIKTESSLSDVIWAIIDPDLYPIASKHKLDDV